MRGAALAVVVLTTACAAAAALALRDEGPEPQAFPADRLLFARDDWLRAPESKLAAAAVDAACGVTVGSGDLDGDDDRDTVLTYSTDRGCGGHDRVAVIRSGGGVQHGPVNGDVDDKSGQVCASGCRVFAVADLYRFDGRHFVEIGRRVYPPRAAGDRRGTSVPGRSCLEPV